MAVNLGSALGAAASSTGLPARLKPFPVLAHPVPAEGARLARTNPLHYTADGKQGGVDATGALASTGAGGPAPRTASGASFQDAMLKAMDGVNASQAKSTDLVQRMLVDPDSVDAQDVTIAMAEANMSLNLARTIMTRVVSAWKDIINTR